MKYLIISLLFITFSLQAQPRADKVFDVDTLTNAGTLTFTLGATLKDLGTIYYHVAADSLSGTPAGTIYYEWSNDADGGEWHAAATDTITNAAATDQSYTVSNFAGLRARIRIVGTGTQSVEISPSIVFKRQW